MQTRSNPIGDFNNTPRLISDHDRANLNSADKAIEEAIRILNRANDSKLFLPGSSRQSREAISLIRSASSWVNAVKARIDSYSPGEAMKITEAYDMMHRIAFNQPADRQFIGNIVMRAFKAMIRGDKNVDQYIMFKLIRKAARQREREFIDKPLSWSCQALNDWYHQAIKGFDREQLSDYDITSRVKILLDSDLYAYEGRNQDQFKNRLSATYSQYLDNSARG